MKKRKLLWSLGLTLFGLNSYAQSYTDKYEFSNADKFVTLGVQPMAYPLAFISSTMQRDLILQKELKASGKKLRIFNFAKGNDMVKFIGPQKIDMAFLGDMPTVNTIVATPVYIAGLGKRNFSSVVSHNYTQLEALKGKRIGYSEGSSSHLMLISGLRAAKMKESDVTLVPMEPSLMPDALEKNIIDAYSAWEPTPAISMARNSQNKAIYRGLSTDWVIVTESTTQSKISLALMAAYVRSINWMKTSKENVSIAATWVIQDGEEFTHKKNELSLDKVVEIVRIDLLGIPGAPTVPAKVDGIAPLHGEFEFLKTQGKIVSTANINLIEKAFTYKGLKQVQSDPQKYNLYTYQYLK